MIGGIQAHFGHIQGKGVKAQICHSPSS